MGNDRGEPEPLDRKIIEEIEDILDKQDSPNRSDPKNRLRNFFSRRHDESKPITSKNIEDEITEILDNAGFRKQKDLPGNNSSESDYPDLREADRLAGIDHSKLPNNSPNTDYGREHKKIMENNPDMWLKARGWIEMGDGFVDPWNKAIFDIHTAVLFQLAREINGIQYDFGNNDEKNDYGESDQYRFDLDKIYPKQDYRGNNQREDRKKYKAGKPCILDMSPEERENGSYMRICDLQIGEVGYTAHWLVNDPEAPIASKPRGTFNVKITGK